MEITNREYTGSFTFEIDPETFQETAPLLAELGAPIVQIDGEYFIVSEPTAARPE